MCNFVSTEQRKQKYKSTKQTLECLLAAAYYDENINLVWHHKESSDEPEENGDCFLPIPSGGVVGLS